MAGNDWVNSYLEAILDVGKGEGIDGREREKEKQKEKFSLLLRERGSFSPQKYFVEEVISGFDETDLYKTWLRAAAMRSPQERNTRLENMCWRIWNLARKKKEIEGEEALRQHKRRMEIEKGRREATADMSDLSEGEKGEPSGADMSARGADTSAHGDSSTRAGRMVRISSIDAIDAWANQHKDKKLYIVLVSIHGLIRGENMELGRDSDTGGQVKYVVELARALGATPGVYRVDLLTRQISAPDVDWSYAEPIEMLAPLDSANSETGESAGAYIIRIPFGPRNKYVNKEQLWPYTQEFVDGALNHIIQMSRVLGEQVGSDAPVWPIIIHGHYADAGDSTALLSGALNVPMIFTGHSLGRDKLDQLLRQGRQTREEINHMYKIMRRIEGEELCLDAAEVVITSTRQEVEEQWSLYDGFDLVLARKLRARIKRGVSCFGRFMPRMSVIPPGMEFKHIASHEEIEGELDGHDDPNPPAIWPKVMKFFTNPRKPMILALARPDPKKNITTLVKAFGECRPLRELANLTLIMGNRDDIDDMSATNSGYLTSVLKLIDKYDLYGQVAYPKHHKQSDVPDIYRLAAKTKGVFINPAFIEPFGLTLIEASAYGLPIVATKNGGPVDIQRVLDNGILVDPHDQNAISDALYKLVSDKQLWAKCRQNGLKNIHQFSWPEHCKTYLSKIITLKPRHPMWKNTDENIDNVNNDSDLDSPNDSLKDIKDISLNLTLSLDGDENVNSGSGKSKLENVIKKLSSVSASSNTETHNTVTNSKIPALRRRKNVFIIAIDSAENHDLVQIVKNIFESVQNERQAGSIGFILSTSLTMSEVHSLLISGGLLSTDFDAFICNSGSDLYYPTHNNDDMLSPHELPFALDLDYHSQIEYKWGGEGLRKTLIRWAASETERVGDKEEKIVFKDEDRSSAFCFAFKVTNPSLVPPVKELRKSMRIQALRCHILYSHDGTKLHVIPVLASRSQALRYLYIRWGVDLSKMVVFVGASGDTDYEGLLGGVHKTIILNGPFNKIASEIHQARIFPIEDVVAFDSPNIYHSQGSDVSDIKLGLQNFGVLKD
ncbi:hypothetical protein LUZ60_017158 [Juncus effusus]|nr:hypothetical protein LUZ60_017158 [Juncus effusus]